MEREGRDFRTQARTRRRTYGLRQTDVRALVLVGDAFVVVAASFLAPEAWALIDKNYQPTAGVLLWQISSSVMWLLFLRFFSAYDIAISPRLRSLLVVGRVAIGMAAVVLGFFFLVPFFSPRGSTLVSVPLVFVALLAWRLLIARLFALDRFETRVAVVGTDDVARRAAHALLEARGIPYKLAGLLTDQQGPTTMWGVPVINTHGDLWGAVHAISVDQLVIGATHSLSVPMLNELVRCFEHGVEATAATQFYEELTGRVLVSGLEVDWYGELPTRTRGIYAAAKRLLDVVVAVVALIFLLPVLFVIALIVFLDSGRPTLIKQLRVGQRGQTFVMHKFRTMRSDAEPDGRAVWAASNDRRVTRVGKLLRRSRLDELPQLWDVLVGRMSLIGPRPERPEFADRLAVELPLYRARTLVRPGITGWAQVRYPYAASVESNLAKLEYDLYYVRHLGLILDTEIAFRTLVVVLGLTGR